jgi:Tfp pilus assembly protein PilF
VWNAGLRHWQPWFRLHLAERDWAEALKVVDNFRKNDKLTASYMTALTYLRMGDIARANAEVEVLRQARQDKKNDRQLERRLNETLGLTLCQTGGADSGVKLLAKNVEGTKNDYSHHAWGNGAYYMEAWGIGALLGNKPDVAEEAFLEALAHDPGSVRAALGMQILCERQGRTQEAAAFAELAHRCWRKADPGLLDAELAWLRGERSGEKVTAGQGDKVTR